MNDNNKFIEGINFPTIVGYDIETNKLLNNEIGTIFFQEIWFYIYKWNNWNLTN